MCVCVCLRACVYSHKINEQYIISTAGTVASTSAPQVPQHPGVPVGIQVDMAETRNPQPSYPSPRPEDPPNEDTDAEACRVCCGWGHDEWQWVGFEGLDREVECDH